MRIQNSLILYFETLNVPYSLYVKKKEYAILNCYTVKNRFNKFFSRFSKEIKKFIKNLII